MSRKIDMDDLSEEDMVYLGQRALLSTDEMSVEDQRTLLSPQNTTTLVDLANTGDVNLSLRTVEELEEELEKRRAVQDGVDTLKLMKPEGIEGALAPEPEEETKPYVEWTKTDLISEIQARNEGLADDEQMHLGGTKAELAAALTADDEKE